MVAADIIHLAASAETAVNDEKRKQQLPVS